MTLYDPIAFTAVLSTLLLSQQRVIEIIFVSSRIVVIIGFAMFRYHDQELSVVDFIIRTLIRSNIWLKKCQSNQVYLYEKEHHNI